MFSNRAEQHGLKTWGILRKRWPAFGSLVFLALLRVKLKWTIMCQHYFRQWEFSIVVKGQNALVLRNKPGRNHVKWIGQKWTFIYHLLFLKWLQTCISLFLWVLGKIVFHNSYKKLKSCLDLILCLCNSFLQD